jgi:hypothetical protein
MDMDPGKMRKRMKEKQEQVLREKEERANKAKINLFNNCKRLITVQQEVHQTVPQLQTQQEVQVQVQQVLL